jgi:hypothetical protein
LGDRRRGWGTSSDSTDERRASVAAHTSFRGRLHRIETREKGVTLKQLPRAGVATHIFKKQIQTERRVSPPNDTLSTKSSCPNPCKIFFQNPPVKETPVTIHL